MYTHSRMEFIIVENKLGERGEKNNLYVQDTTILVVILLSLEHSWNLINVSANRRISGRDSMELVTGFLQVPRSEETGLVS